MIQLGVWASAAACLIVSLFISFWAGRRYETFWPKFAFFSIASVIGITLFPFFNGLCQGAMPRQEHLIDAEFRKQFFTVICGVLAMAYVGTWRLQQIIENR
jgi:hypothetical protein